MIQIGDKVEIKQNKRGILSNLFLENKSKDRKLHNCGVDPYHKDMKFVLVKTYGNQFIVRVFGGKQHYTLHKDLFKKVN